jgi:hypothetical protein
MSLTGSSIAPVAKDGLATAKNEASKTIKICCVNEVYTHFMAEELTAAAAKDKVTEWEVTWPDNVKTGLRTCANCNKPKYVGKSGSNSKPDVTFRKRLINVALFGIEKVELDEETFMGEAEECYKKAAAKSNKGTSTDEESGESEGDEDETGQSEYQGTDEDEGEIAEEEKLTPVKISFQQVLLGYFPE